MVHVESWEWEWEGEGGRGDPPAPPHDGADDGRMEEDGDDNSQHSDGDVEQPSEEEATDTGAGTVEEGEAPNHPRQVMPDSGDESRRGSGGRSPTTHDWQTVTPRGAKQGVTPRRFGQGRRHPAAAAAAPARARALYGGKTWKPMERSDASTKDREAHDSRRAGGRGNYENCLKMGSGGKGCRKSSLVAATLCRGNLPCSLLSRGSPWEKEARSLTYVGRNSFFVKGQTSGRQTQAPPTHAASGGEPSVDLGGFGAGGLHFLKLRGVAGPIQRVGHSEPRVLHAPSLDLGLLNPRGFGGLSSSVGRVGWGLDLLNLQAAQSPTGLALVIQIDADGPGLRVLVCGPCLQPRCTLVEDRARAAGESCLSGKRGLGQGAEDSSGRRDSGVCSHGALELGVESESLPEIQEMGRESRNFITGLCSGASGCNPIRSSARLASTDKGSAIRKAMLRKAILREGEGSCSLERRAREVARKSRLLGVELDDAEAFKLAAFVANAD